MYIRTCIYKGSRQVSFFICQWLGHRFSKVSWVLYMNFMEKDDSLQSRKLLCQLRSRPLLHKTVQYIVSSKFSDDRSTVFLDPPMVTGFCTSKLESLLSLTLINFDFLYKFKYLSIITCLSINRSKSPTISWLSHRTLHMYSSLLSRK